MGLKRKEKQFSRGHNHTVSTAEVVAEDAGDEVLVCCEPGGYIGAFVEGLVVGHYSYLAASTRAQERCCWTRNA